MERVLIVEDDVFQKNLLVETIQKHYPSWDVHTATTLREALSSLNQSIHTSKPYSLFLLDIQLSEHHDNRDGFLFAKRIRSSNIYSSTPILFLTILEQHIRYALSNFHCYNYITKPYTPASVILQIQSMQASGFLGKTILTITDSSRMHHYIAQDNIVYFQSNKHTLIIQTTNGTLKARDTSLQSIHQKVGGQFVQCHRRYIINTAYISDYDKTNCFIRIHTHTIPVGRKYKQNIESLL